MKTNCSPWLYVSGLAFEPWIAFLIGLQMMWESKEDNLKKKKTLIHKEFSLLIRNSLTDTDISPGEGTPYKRDASQKFSKTRDKAHALDKNTFHDIFFLFICDLP